MMISRLLLFLRVRLIPSSLSLSSSDSRDVLLAIDTRARMAAKQDLKEPNTKAAMHNENPTAPEAINIIRTVLLPTPVHGKQTRDAPR